MKSVSTQYRVQNPLKIPLLCMTEMNGLHTHTQGHKTIHYQESALPRHNSKGANAVMNLVSKTESITAAALLSLQLVLLLRKWVPKQLVAGFPPRWPGFKPGSSHVGFVVGKVALGQVFSECFSFPCQSSFHQFFHNHHHLSSGAGTSGRSTQSPTAKIKKKSGCILFGTTIICGKHILQ
jgi:hypothetical protein